MAKVRKAGTRAATGYADTYGGRTTIEADEAHQSIINLIELIGNWENGIEDINQWRKDINKAFKNAVDVVENTLYPSIQDLKTQTEIERAKEILRKHGIEMPPA